MPEFREQICPYSPLSFTAALEICQLVYVSEGSFMQVCYLYAKYMQIFVSCVTKGACLSFLDFVERSAHSALMRLDNPALTNLAAHFVHRSIAMLQKVLAS